MHMKPQDVEVVIGDDPSVLQQLNAADPRDPSGFLRYGYRPENLAALCALVRETAVLVRSKVPAELLEHMPQRIPLYGDQTIPGISASALNMSASTDSSKLQPFRGMTIGLPPGAAEKRDQQLWNVTGHEHLHTAIYGGPEATPVNESFVGRLEQEYFPNSSEYRRDPRWAPDAFRSSTGFRVDDYASYGRCKEMFAAEYMWASHAMRFLTAEQVWKVCVGLVKEGRSTGTFPRFGSVADAITGEDAANGRKVLATPPFLPMTAGPQQFIFTLGTDHADVYSYLVSANPAYNPAGATPESRVQFYAQSAQGRKQLTFNLHDGRVISADIDTLPPSQGIDFHELARVLQQQTGIPVSQIRSIDCAVHSGKFQVRP